MAGRSDQAKHAVKDLEARFQKWAKTITDKLVVVEQAITEAGQQLQLLGPRVEQLEAQLSKVEEVIPAAPVKLATSVLVESIGDAVKELRADLDELSERVSPLECEVGEMSTALCGEDPDRLPEERDTDSPPDDDEPVAGGLAAQMPIIANAPRYLGGATSQPAPALGEVVSSATAAALDEPCAPSAEWVDAPGAKGGRLPVTVSEMPSGGWVARVEPSDGTIISATGAKRGEAVAEALAEARRARPELFAGPVSPSPQEAQEQLAVHSEAPAGLPEMAAVYGDGPPREVITSDSSAPGGGVRIVGGRVVD